MSFTIFTDTGSDYSDKMATEMGVKVLPLTYIINGESYISITDELMKFAYNALREKANVSTSCCNVYTIQNELEKELKKGNDIIYLAFSSGLSATYNNAIEARDNLAKEYQKSKIYIIDSLSASLGHGMLVTYASKLKNEGKSIEEVVDFIESNKLRLTHLFTVDNLYHLYNGGRITKSTYLIATVAKIKPIMHVNDEGKLEALTKVISRRKSLNTLINMTLESIDSNSKDLIYISHGDCLEDALYIKRKLLEKLPESEIYIDYISPVIGMHSGPGTVAVFYFSKHRI